MEENKPPVFHWYISKDRDWDANMTVFNRSDIYSGYYREPDYETIEKHDLRYVGIGDLDWLRQQHK